MTKFINIQAYSNYKLCIILNVHKIINLVGIIINYNFTYLSTFYSSIDTLIFIEIILLNFLHGLLVINMKYYYKYSYNICSV